MLTIFVTEDAYFVINFAHVLNKQKNPKTFHIKDSRMLDCLARRLMMCNDFGKHLLEDRGLEAIYYHTPLIVTFD